MTAIAAAMKKAGVRTASERLAEAIDLALDHAEGNFERALSALSAAVSSDAALCWEAFAPYRAHRLGELLRDGAKAKRAKESKTAPGASGAGRAAEAATSGCTAPARSNSLPAGEGLVSRVNHIDLAPLSRQTHATMPEGQNILGNQEVDAPGVVAAAHAPQGAADGEGHRGDCIHVDLAPPSATTAGHAAITRVAMKTILDSHMTELDKPVGDCTLAELTALGRRNRKRAWFYDGLAQRMPETGIARRYWTQEDAQDLWQRAELANTTEIQI